MIGHVKRVNLKQAHRELVGKLASLKNPYDSKNALRVLHLELAIQNLEQNLPF